MKILWLQWKGKHSAASAKAAAAKEGVGLDILEITDMSYSAGSGGNGVFANGADLVNKYDVLCVRTYYPARYISDVMALAGLFKHAGKMVSDESLTHDIYPISKMYDYVLLASAGVEVPRSFLSHERAELQAKAEELGFPVVLKGIHGKMGNSVFMAKDEGQFRRIIRQYGDGELILQQFIPGDRDCRVIVVGYKALPFMVNRFCRPGDFRTNSVDEAKEALSDYPGLRETAELAAATLKREFSSVDIRMLDGKPLVLEVNRFPSPRSFEEATGIDVSAEFIRYLKRKFYG